MGTKIDLTGQRFGQLTVLVEAGRSPAGQACWLCKCDCGKVIVARGQNLRIGNYKSCGCLKPQRLAKMLHRHGHSPSSGPSPEYRAYHNMIGRCDGSREGDREGYHERGIRVCDRWLAGQEGKTGFECFLADVGRRSSPRLSLNRINNDGDYEPSNVEWADDEVQQNNKRSNRIVNYHGKATTFAKAWKASAKVVTYHVAHSRCQRGWPAEDAIDLPPVPFGGNRKNGPIYRGVPA